MSRTSLLVHVVWSTKRGEHLLHPNCDPWLHDTLARKASDVDARLVAFGAAMNHVHVLLHLSPAHALVEVIQRMKGASSFLANREGHIPGLAWQDGYWAESCAPRGLDTLVAYVTNQRSRHADPNAPPEDWELDT